MKKRIKIDSSILSFIIILTGLLYQFPRLYTYGLFADDVFDFLGLFIILLGTYLRMVSRGYKKANSKKGQDLVTGGPYSVTRNPMYLGSFLMGSGFVFIVWPFWSLIIFAVLFYFRFNKQMVKEEEYLAEHFAETYTKYAKKTSRIFPTVGSFKKMEFKKAFPLEFALGTKEKLGLVGWPLLAVFMEVLQEKIVYGILDFTNAFKVFALSMIVFVLILWILYKNA